MSLTLTGVTKHFGTAIALNNVSFSVSAGQVHALLGENGAGKSTLMRIAYGLLQADSGTIAVRQPDGSEVTVPGFATPRAARAAGIGMVHQHFNSIPALTVAENIALAAGWNETGRAAERRAHGVMDRLGLVLPANRHVEGLSVQLRQRLEIVKALATDARILLLDEPTAMLAPRETDELLKFVRAFAAAGNAVVLITHKLDEAIRAAGHVTVLLHGEVALNGSLAAESPQSLSRAMIGGELPRSDHRAGSRGDVLVRAEQLVLNTGVPPIANSFEIYGGEIAAIAAIDGNGQRELLRAIADVDEIKVTAGTLVVTGPVAFISEDRTTEGLIGSFTLAENLLLGSPERSTAWLDWQEIRGRANELMRAHDVRAASSDVAAATLSGGNQQKFILARALDAAPRVIVAEDPTRGLDVLATQVVHERLRDAARNGAAVVVHSSDLDEVLELADRLFVITRGELRELPAGTSRTDVGDTMLALDRSR